MKKLQLTFFLLCIAVSTMAQWNDTGNPPHIYNTNNGNVGIGTTSPIRNVDVRGIGTIGLNIGDASSLNIKTLQFNESTDWSIQSNGTSYLRFHTNGLEQLRINSSGDVGVGTTSPNRKLHVLGSGSSVGLKVEASDGNQASLDLTNSEGAFSLITNGGTFRIYDDGDSSERLRLDTNGNLGIGTISPVRNVDVRGAGTIGLNIGDASSLNVKTLQFNESTDWSIQSNGESYLRFHANGLEQIRINSSGNVGIGTTTPDEKLTVKGKIHAEEVIIDLNVPAPDYVFEPDYQLRDLDELQQFIETNKHLPEVPSAATMEEEGISVSEMNMLLLKKVEELTLYILDQENKIQNQQNQISAQNSRIDKLEKLINQ